MKEPQEKKLPSILGYTLVPTQIIEGYQDKIESLEWNLNNYKEAALESQLNLKTPFRWFQFWQKAVMVAVILLALVVALKYSKELVK